MKYGSIGASCRAVALAAASPALANGGHGHGAVDTVSTEAATFMVLTQVDFMDAVPTSLAVAIGADTAGTAEATADTADKTMDPVLLAA